MLHTISNFKNISKKGLDFVKSVTVDTYTSIKKDICQKKEVNKAFKKWYKDNYPNQTTSK